MVALFIAYLATIVIGACWISDGCFSSEIPKFFLALELENQTFFEFQFGDFQSREEFRSMIALSAPPTSVAL